MVNRGRSKGCATCKERRVKCDEGRPSCHTCQRLGRRCGGYATKAPTVRFKDQSRKFANERKTTKQLEPRRSAAKIRLHGISEPDTSVPFYLSHYATMGREMTSARGFFEILVPMYCSQPQDSALCLAVSAVASTVMGLWRSGPRGMQASHRVYTQAVGSVLRAVGDEVEQRKPATAMAIMALQIYENVTAVYGLRAASRVHQNGVMALLKDLDGHNDPDVRANIQRYAFHTEIASALREKKAVKRMDELADGGGILLKENASSRLDRIGGLVADLQTRHCELQKLVNQMNIPGRDWEDQIYEARRIDEQLLAWLRSVPEQWHPIRLTSGVDIDGAIPTYQATCEVYESCQKAAIWNLWRIQRLILAGIIRASQVVLSPAVAEQPVETLADQITTVQELVDSVCYSVPFYLGNRILPVSLSDFTDQSLLFPSDNVPTPNHCGSPGRRGDHVDHIIAQGPWHLMSPLSRLLTLFGEESGQSMAFMLRDGQLEWLKQQFLRVTTLLHISPDTSAAEEEALSPQNEEKADMLAVVLRRGARFMSGS